MVANASYFAECASIFAMTLYIDLIGCGGADVTAIDLTASFKLCARPSGRLRRSSPGAEEDISTIEAEAEPNPRFSAAQRDRSRKGRAQASSQKGAKAAGRRGCSEVVWLKGAAAVTGAPETDQRFPRSQRLRRRKDFLRIQQWGIKVSAHPLVALALENRWNVTRLGITVSSKVGNAVLRNRIRRLLREIIRRRRDRLPRGIDIVLIASPSAASEKFASLQTAYCALESQLLERFR